MIDKHRTQSWKATGAFTGVEARVKAAISDPYFNDDKLTVYVGFFFTRPPRRKRTECPPPPPTCTASPQPRAISHRGGGVWQTLNRIVAGKSDASGPSDHQELGRYATTPPPNSRSWGATSEQTGWAHQRRRGPHAQQGMAPRVLLPRPTGGAPRQLRRGGALAAECGSGSDRGSEGGGLYGGGGTQTRPAAEPTECGKRDGLRKQKWGCPGFDWERPDAVPVREKDQPDQVGWPV
jgi:hypothetical protein